MVLGGARYQSMSRKKSEPMRAVRAFATLALATPSAGLNAIRLPSPATAPTLASRQCAPQASSARRPSIPELPRATVAEPLALLLLSQLVLFVGVGAVIPTIAIYGKGWGGH